MTKTSRPIGTVIPARFPGLCRNCRQDYQRGDLIRKAADKVWIHDACPNGESLQPSSPVTPTENMAHELQLVRGIVRDELAGATLKVDEAEVRLLIDADVTRIVSKTREEMLAQGVVKQQIEVLLPSGQTTVIDGKAHAALPRCIRLAAARRHVLLVGPAGSGKTHLAEQVAKGLGLEFAHISCSAGMSEGQLLGRLLPVGDGGKFEYVRSEFVRCYEEGGVFLFDEIDAADANTLLVLNAALANGRMALPNRPGNPVAIRHPDFVCIAAANTFGTGADRQYVGRSQLDESTLDRFRIGQVEMDYDGEVEAALCPDDALRTRLQGYRHAVQRNRMRRVVSSRFLRDAFVMKHAGDTDAEIDAALFAGWSADEVRKMEVQS